MEESRIGTFNDKYNFNRIKSIRILTILPMKHVYNK